jgi:Ca-activated chloride channel family protein
VNLAKPTASQEASKPIRSTTLLVQLTVVVTDKSGQPVAGLKKEDFAVLDEGKPQEIAFFSGQVPPAVEAKTQLPNRTGAEQ